MWTKLAYIILKFRLWIILALLAFTAFMGYQGQYVKWSYDLLQIVPEDDPDMVAFQQFRDTFGEDANVLAIGIEDSSIYNIEQFLAFDKLTKKLEKIEGIRNVVALPQLVSLSANRKLSRFEARDIFENPPASQAELDSALSVVKGIRFYEQKIINKESGATLVLITMDAEYLNSARRIDVMGDILRLTDAFTESTQIDLHFAGLPFVRSIMVTKVKAELNMFLIISICISAFILFLFFRSFSPVFYPLIVIGMVITWTIGTLSLLDFKITMLTGLLPPIMVVIGIPNCIYLLNKYHQEFATHGQKKLALTRVIKKIGVVTLITNTTTAIGFFVLTFTGIAPLQEFGLVASINIFGAFLISILLIPAVFSYLPEPKQRNVKHLDFKPINQLLAYFNFLVNHRRVYVYVVVGGIAVLAFIGMLRVEALSYMVDDLPDDSSIKKDLAFFESRFSGIMPLEIIIDTGRKKGFRKRSALEKIDKLENYLDSVEQVSPPVSLVTFLKAANQSFFGSEADYRLPSTREIGFIQTYLRNQADSSQLSDAFVDESGQYLRISMKVADIGSKAMEQLLEEEIRPNLARIFADSDMSFSVTGTTVIFIKGNSYLINNLLNSMLIAFVLIAIIMGTLFGNVRIILISLIPNTIPLLITAGLMGFFGIPLKPSTVLVFSIAFGISVDDSIHFLAKYRQELYANHFNIGQAIDLSLKETGKSMVYTSIVLFFGFAIFVFSDFGGTIALGGLTSVTLFVAMLTNLILLPALLRSFDVDNRKVVFDPLIDTHAGFYLEDEDEEIDTKQLSVKKDTTK